MAASPVPGAQVPSVSVLQLPGTRVSPQGRFVVQDECHWPKSEN